MNYRQFCRVYGVDSFHPHARAAYDLWVESLPLYTDRQLMEEQKQNPNNEWVPVDITFDTRSPHHWVILIFIILGILFLWFIAPSLMG